MNLQFSDLIMTLVQLALSACYPQMVTSFVLIALYHYVDQTAWMGLSINLNVRCFRSPCPQAFNSAWKWTEKCNKKISKKILTKPLFKICIFFRPEGAVQVNSPEYCCIAPLRALEMKKNNPDMWRRFLLLMDHDEERKLETDYQEMFQVCAIKIKGYLLS